MFIHLVHQCDEKTKGGCAHHCNKKGDGVKCSCREGFLLSADGKSCKKGINTRFSSVRSLLNKQLFLYGFLSRHVIFSFSDLSIFLLLKRLLVSRASTPFKRLQSVCKLQKSRLYTHYLQ